MQQSHTHSNHTRSLSFRNLVPIFECIAVLSCSLSYAQVVSDGTKAAAACVDAVMKGNQIHTETRTVQAASVTLTLSITLAGIPLFCPASLLYRAVSLKPLTRPVTLPVTTVLLAWLYSAGCRQCARVPAQGVTVFICCFSLLCFSRLACFAACTD